MALPRRTFTADEGQRSTGAAGPDAIEYDLDNAFAMFNPLASLRTGEPGGIDAEENIRDVRLIPDQKPQSDTGKIPALLSGLANRIKAIMGTPDWKNDPPTTLAALASQSNQINIDQNAAPTGDIGNIQQVVSWLANRIKAITGRNDWKDDPAVNLQTLADVATHEDISFHSQSKSTHGVGPGFYIAKTSRSDQYPSWNDIKDKPSLFPPERHQHDASDVVAGVFDVNRIPNLPASKITTGQFDPNLIPGLPASKVTSGTFSVDRLPKASLTQQGIVQLTNSRTSTREDLALTAKAMNDHRTSADHDDRYAPRSEIQQMIAQALAGAALRIQTGSYTGNGQSPRTISLNFQPKVVAVWPSTIGAGLGQGGSIAIGFAGASASIVGSVGVYERGRPDEGGGYYPGIARAVRHPNFSGSEYDNEHQSGVWPQSNGFMVYRPLNANGVSYGYMAIG